MVFAKLILLSQHRAPFMDTNIGFQNPEARSGSLQPEARSGGLQPEAGSENQKWKPEARRRTPRINN